MNVILVFLQKAITQGIPLLLGANGEILTEKSGNLNLGIPGLMYMGGVAGLIGAFLYENNVAAPIPFVGMLIALVCCLLASALGALIYSVLTITLRANQNVTGLALTTFGMGFGNFFGGSLSKLSGEAKARIAAYLAEELRRYLALSLRTQEHINNLELAADVCKHFANEEILSLLSEVLGFGYGNVNYYAAETLLAAGKELPREAIVSLAKDLGYADLTYRLLGKYGKQALFPEECRTAEYLAKSDMVHWLLYPTELGKAPDEIEYVGKVTYLFKKDVYYVFRFRSDSDTLGEEKKNKWLIGWSSEDGGTFSNFDEYALYEKGTVEATLKNIKKKLIG